MHTGQAFEEGRYQLLQKLGRGGMGEVWKANDTKFNRVVAIKGLSEGSAPGLGVKRRLEREAALQALLKHNGIVPIIDTFIDDDKLYLVMWFIEGTDLEKAGRSGALTDAAKVSILADVLSALAYLHEQTTVIHRDLKPSNILLGTDNQAYVADFGIAQSQLDPNATESQFLVGTRLYMAPEVQAGRPASHESDMWSFGAIALWLFTGRTPDLLDPEMGIPEGNFAGSLSDGIRATLSRDPSRRPSASHLLPVFRQAQHEGVTAVVPLAPQTEALPLPVSPPTAATATEARRRRWIPAVLVLAVLVALVGAAAALMNPPAPGLQGDPTTPAAAPAPTTPTPTPTSSSPTPTPSSPTPTPSTPTPTPSTPTPTTTDKTASSGPGWYYLANMDPIETEIEGRAGRCTGGCAAFGDKPASIAGVIYPQSYVMRMDSDGKRSTSLWNAYTKCTKFEATIGLDDSSSSVKTHFLLERENGATEDLGILPTGVPQKVSVDLTGVFRFKLVSFLATAAKSDSTQKAVWGDARMFCSPLPSPTP